MSAVRILIVEDDRSLADILVYNLRAASFEPLVKYDGRQGLQAARENPPEMVLLDLMLPGIDGLEVCRRLRADPVTREILVMMLTHTPEILRSSARDKALPGGSLDQPHPSTPSYG